MWFDGGLDKEVAMIYLLVRTHTSIHVVYTIDWLLENVCNEVLLILYIVDIQCVGVCVCIVIR